MAGLAEVTFLRQESLNLDLMAFLQRKGFSPEQIAFINTHELLNVTVGGSANRSQLWTPKALEYVSRAESLLFDILDERGINYDVPRLSARPIRILGRVSNKVERLQSHRRSIDFKKRRESFQQMPVPFVGIDCTLGFRPFQKVVEKLENGDGTVRIVALASSEHELVETIMGCITVGAEIVSATIDCDEPGVTVLTEPGLWITRHCRKPSS